MQNIFNTKTRFFRIWKQMHNRRKIGIYKQISVSERWTNFDCFYEDMHNSYCEHVAKFGERDTTIDRIDNNEGYSKENCRWATMEVQGNNRSNNRFLSFNGETLSLSQWSRKLGITRQALYSRIETNGWPLERALSPSKNPKTKLETLIKDVRSGKFGSKNKVELLQRLEEFIIS